MKCKEIQEVLLTDYLDGMMNEQNRREAEAHLSSCVYCKEFMEIAIESTVEPFKNAPKLSLSHEKIWQRIKEEIISEEKFEDVPGKLVNRANNPILVPLFYSKFNQQFSFYFYINLKIIIECYYFQLFYYEYFQWFWLFFENFEFHISIYGHNQVVYLLSIYIDKNLAQIIDTVYLYFWNGIFLTYGEYKQTIL